jgi:putative DNA primase/helicase
MESNSSIAETTANNNDLAPTMGIFKEQLQDLSRWLVENKMPGIEIPNLVEPDPVNATDIGNAERLVKRFGDNIRFCYLWNCWIIWDGKKWVKDEKGIIFKFAKETVRAIYGEASRFTDDKKRRDIGKHALRSESRNRIEAMIELAKSDLPISPDELDKDPMLLNCLNGTIDLRTCSLLPYERKNYCSKIIPVEYMPGAECPTWEKFLYQVMAGDNDLVQFLQMAIGYSLTGDTKEQCLFFLYGCGANGKSTFLNIILKLLGDYAQQTPVETLMMKNSGGVPNDIARLKGARFVAAVEAEQGRRLAESTIKQLTGGDTITARFMRAEWFEFKPEFKIVLATNHRPEIKGTDEGIWRRIRLIPFEVTFPKEKQDKSLPAKLEAELPGILNWALAGCLAWQNEGLPVPDKVIQATSEYRMDMDALSRFFEERCIFNSQKQVASGELFRIYCKWCEECGEEPINRTAFGLRLKEKGCASVRVGANRIYHYQGVGLIANYQQNLSVVPNI